MKGKKTGVVSNDGLNIFVIGGGLTYYFPENFFASASVGASDISVSINGTDYVSTLDAGFAFNLSVGKEWWVGNQIGIGIEFAYTHIRQR